MPTRRGHFEVKWSRELWSMAVERGAEIVRGKGEWLSWDCKRVSTLGALSALSVIEKAITKVAVTVAC